MQQSRRSLLKLLGGAAGGGVLVGSASPATAHAKPSMDWVAADSSNYDDANRESDWDIRWFVVHVAEGSYEGTIDWFQNPDADASAHYVVENDSPADATGMVAEEDAAWHAGNWSYNKHSLGVEHEGHTDETTFVDPLYEKSARIAQWAGETFGFPLRVRRYDIAPCDALDGAGGVIGHDQIPDPNDCSKSGGANHHSDPGSTWNWGRYEGFLRRYHLDTWESVVTNADLSVREGPGTSYSRVDVAPEGTSGAVIDGPVDNDGYRWYEVSYDEGIADGWSAANWLLYSRFDIWKEATAGTDLSVRNGPGTSYDRIDVAPDGTSGTVVDGPVDNDGYRWFELDYDGGVSTGWSAGYYLE